jgi:putative Mn2+ efflux pump MntP
MNYILLSIIIGIFIGLALSVDAFMLSLVYGITLNNRKEAFLTALFVGVFHFIMPLIGYYLTYIILSNIFMITSFQNNFKDIGTYLLIILGLVMVFKKEDCKKSPSIKNLVSKLLFAFTVSIDSFIIGIGLTTNDHISIVIIATLFFIISATMTLIALALIHKTKKFIVSKNLNVLAGIILVLFGFISLLI